MQTVELRFSAIVGRRPEHAELGQETVNILISPIAQFE